MRRPEIARVEVYSDGSVSPARMDNLTSSSIDRKFVGRVAVLIPQLDFGFLGRVTEGALTADGNPASTNMEILAIKRARDICVERRIDEYVILTDNVGAAERAGVKEAEWLASGKVHYASLLLERILNRARYLRHSRKVISRTAPNRLQEEIFRMFEADKMEFQLSKSLLWNKIQIEMAAAAR